MENALEQSTSENMDVQIKEDIKKEMLQSPSQTLDDSLLSIASSTRFASHQPRRLRLGKEVLVKQWNRWWSAKEAPIEPAHGLSANEAPTEQMLYLRGDQLRGLQKGEMENAFAQSSSENRGVAPNEQSSQNLRVPVPALPQGPNESRGEAGGGNQRINNLSSARASKEAQSNSDQKISSEAIVQNVLAKTKAVTGQVAKPASGLLAVLSSSWSAGVSSSHPVPPRSVEWIQEDQQEKIWQDLMTACHMHVPREILDGVQVERQNVQMRIQTSRPSQQIMAQSQVHPQPQNWLSSIESTKEKCEENMQKGASDKAKMESQNQQEKAGGMYQMENALAAEPQNFTQNCDQKAEKS